MLERRNRNFLSVQILYADLWLEASGNSHMFQYCCVIASGYSHM